MAESLAGTPDPSACHATRWSLGARAGVEPRACGTARRGMALVRMLVLIGFTGFLVAAVVATVFAGLVIAINGQLP